MLIKNKQKIMNCAYDTTNIRIKLIDNQHIGIAHCCYREAEKVNPLSFNDLYNMSNEEFWNYLQESYKMIPPDHNYEPAYFCNTNQKCYYNDKEIKKIAVSVFRHCNIKCKMCMVSSNDFLPFEESKKLYFAILNKIKNHNLIQMSLTENGEPFIVKKETFEYLDSLTTNDFKQIEIISNMTLLNEDDILHLADINSRIPIVFAASCSGITKETYKAIHKNDNFDKVINNIISLCNKNFLSHISYVVQSENLHELPFIIDFWKSKNIHTCLQIHPIIGFNGNEVINTAEYKNFKSLYPNEMISI